MKLSNYISISACALFLVCFSLFNYCYAEDDTKAYSDALKEAILEGNMTHVGYSPLPSNKLYKILGVKEAIPYLLDVIKNGPDWSLDERFDGRDAYFARGYAIMCLAYTKEPQVYSVLIDIVKNGIDLQEAEADAYIMEKIREYDNSDANRPRGGLIVDPKEREKQMREPLVVEGWDLRANAALGLGILGDPNARDVLVEALKSENSQVRIRSFQALAGLHDMRAIKPMIEIAGSDPAIDQLTFDEGMRTLIMLRLESDSFEVDGGRYYVQFKDFPELGNIPLEQDARKKAWIHWFKTGEQRTKQQFDIRHNKFKEAKAKNLQNYNLSYEIQALREMGIAALPLLIEKIQAGETEFIPLVSEFSNYKLKPDASKEEVLLWWKDNEERMTIFKKTEN